MANQNSVIVYAEREAERLALVAALESAGGLEPPAATGDPSELSALLARTPGATALVMLGEKADLALDALEAALPRPAFVALGPEDEGRLILRAMRLGASEYLPAASDAASVLAALERTRGAARPEPTRGRNGRVVAVLGAKGGVGATLVASQLALALRRGGAEVALADLNLRHGDVALYLDLHPRYDLVAAASAEAQPDATFLGQVLHAHSEGLRVLAAPQQPEDAELIAADRVLDLLGLLRAEHDWVVLDLARDFGDVMLAALDCADEILLVTALDIPSLHHTRRVIGLLERIGHPSDRVRLIANRCENGSAVGERDVSEFLGRASDLRLTNDWHAAQESVNYGRALAESAPKSALTHGFAELAGQLHDWTGIPRPESAPKRGLLGTLFGKKA